MLGKLAFGHCGSSWGRIKGEEFKLVFSSNRPLYTPLHNTNLPKMPSYLVTGANRGLGVSTLKIVNI